MTNQPIEEKWKIDFRKEFPSFLTDTHNGKIVPIHNGWWVFVQGDKRRNLPQDIEDFIENLLEQERQRMSDEVKELPWLHNDSGVKELKENVDYVEVKEVLSIINK